VATASLSTLDPENPPVAACFHKLPGSYVGEDFVVLNLLGSSVETGVTGKRIHFPAANRYLRRTMTKRLALALTFLSQLAFVASADEFPPVRTIVNVVDESGSPVEGATVRYLKWNYTGTDPDSDAKQGTTDSEGLWEKKLPWGDYQFSVTKGRLANVGSTVVFIRVKKGNPAHEQKFTLKPGGTIRGTVRSSETNQPVGDALIVLDTSAVTRSFADGSFRLEPVPFGERVIKVRKPGFGDRHLTLNVSEKTFSQDIDVQLDDGWQVVGTIIDEAGRPVEGAQVGDHYSGKSIHCLMRDVLTDRNGLYSLGWYPKTSELWSFGVEHEDFAKVSVSGLEPPKEGSEKTHDFTLSKGFSIAGNVSDEEGKPIKGAYVNYGTNKSHVRHRSTKSDGAGNYVLDKIPTDVAEKILVEARGFAPQFRQLVPTLDSEESDAYFFLEKGGVATGKLSDPNGNPVSSATISVRWESNEAGRFYIGRRYKPDKTGRFVIDGLPEGTLLIEVYGTGWSDYREHILDLKNDNLLTIYPEGVIEGTVVDKATGDPVESFNVSLEFPDEPVREGERRTSFSSHLSDRGQECQSLDGRFEIADLIAQSRLHILVKAEGYPSKRIPSALIRPKGNSQPLWIELERE